MSAMRAYMVRSHCLAAVWATCECRHYSLLVSSAFIASRLWCFPFWNCHVISLFVSYLLYYNTILTKNLVWSQVSRNLTVEERSVRGGVAWGRCDVASLCRRDVGKEGVAGLWNCGVERASLPVLVKKKRQTPRDGRSTNVGISSRTII